MYLKAKRLLRALAGMGEKKIFVTNKETFNLLQKMKRQKFLSIQKKVFVNHEAEQLVLYGRNVFSKSIVKFGNLRTGDKCFIVNENNEFIGIGRMKKDMVENLIDKGWYLRNGG